MSWLRLPHDGWPGRVLHGAMGFLLGLELHSLWTLAWLLALNRTNNRTAFIAFDVLLPLLIAGSVFSWRRRSKRRQTAAASAPEPGNRGELAWFVAAATLVSLAALATAFVAAALPHGGYDAWAVWNTKAIWMAEGGANWSTFLTDSSLLSAHPDYPLFLPAAVSRLWMIIGEASQLAPQVLAVAMAPLAVAIVGAGAWSHRGALAGVAASAAVLGVQQLVITAGLQYADVPLACAYAACAVALAYGQREGGVSRWYLVAGLAAGTAMWTKNEGNLFVACALVSAGLTSVATGRGIRIAASRLGYMTAGLLPFLAAALYVKTAAPLNLIVSQQTTGVLVERLLDLSRHTTIIGHTARMIGAVLSPWALALLAAFLALRGRAARHFSAAAQTLLLVALVTTGYYFVFVMTPYPLNWHLDTTAYRLFIHVWPTLVFGLVLASGCETPGPGDQHRSATA